MSDWRDQEVRNETRSRDRNEWIAQTRGDVALDHENPEVDQLVSEGGRFTVVEKIAGTPARIARETDLRHHDAE